MDLRRRCNKGIEKVYPNPIEICSSNGSLQLRPLLTTSSEFSEKNSAHVVGSTFPLRNVLFRSSEEQSRIISEIEATQTHVLAFKVSDPALANFAVNES
jgi:hypothetical protein